MGLHPNIFLLLYDSSVIGLILLTGTTNFYRTIAFSLYKQCYKIYIPDKTQMQAFYTHFILS